MIKTCDEFNEKYKDYLEVGHYGMSWNTEKTLEYLDKVFEGLIKIPGFKYTQIKQKFGMTRFYTNLHEILGKADYISNAVEKHIDFLERVDNEVCKRIKEENDKLT